MTAPGGLPPELAAGPCVEVWAPAGEPAPPFAGPYWAAYRARRRWEAAVIEWATSTGWATDRRPALNALNLARTKRPWSRDYLRARGELELLAYYTGRTTVHPGRDRAGWDIGTEMDPAG